MMFRSCYLIVPVSLTLLAAGIPGRAINDDRAEEKKITIDTPTDSIPSGEKVHFGVGGTYTIRDGDNILVGLYQADEHGEATGKALTSADPVIKADGKRWSAELGCRLGAETRYVIKAELRKGTEVLDTASVCVTSKQPPDELLVGPVRVHFDLHLRQHAAKVGHFTPKPLLLELVGHSRLDGALPGRGNR